MAKFFGKLREKKPRDLVRRLTTRMSLNFRLEAELEEGYGPHLLAERLRSMELPESVTVVLQPTLGFLSADVCLISPGRVLVMNALHWAGPIRPGPGKTGEWTGAGGGVDLGRPDRRANLLADRLEYSGLTAGFEVLPVVVFTAGPVQFLGEESLATLVQWADLDEFVSSLLSAQAQGPSADQLIAAVTPS